MAVEQKNIVVSGCPRSGTSLMTRLISLALGENRIYGEKFPQESRLKNSYEQGQDETNQQFEYRKYVNSFFLKKEKEDFEKSKDLNPGGFWECMFTISGLKYSTRAESSLKDLEAKKEPSVLKVVSQGLAESDPRYINKIIFMLRDPKSVARSQERLNRDFTVNFKNGPEINLYDGITIHSPKMFIQVSIAAMLWIDKHPEISVHFVCYDDLIDKPSETLFKIGEFLGEKGNWDKASEEINPKLRRSYPQEKKSNLWKDAEDVYLAMLSKNFDKIKDIKKNPKRHIQRETTTWSCARIESAAMEKQCLDCHSNRKGFRDNLKKYSEKEGIPWRKRPCAFEVAFCLDEELISLEDSVKRNHWE